jgi:hypothetical protein
MSPTSPRAFLSSAAAVKRVLLVLLLVAAALIAPTTSGIAHADGSQDPPATISVEGPISDSLKSQITDFNDSVAAQQRVEQNLIAEKASLEAQATKIEAAIQADNAAGDATDQLFAEHNTAVQAYNAAGPPGDPAYAAELDAEGQQLEAQQAQNNAKASADNAARDKGLAAMVAHNKRGDEYKSTNQKLIDERAKLMAELLTEQAAAYLPIIATLTTVDSLSGMDSPQPTQGIGTDGGDYTAPANGPPAFVTNALESLPKWRSGSATVGRIFDSKGNSLAGELESGGNSTLVQAADAFLRKYGTPINPITKFYTASQHVEAEYAMLVRKKVITDTHVTVVINNARGVCRGKYGCMPLQDAVDGVGAVALILPEGSTMTVWYPNATEPVVIIGVAVR